MPPKKSAKRPASKSQPKSKGKSPAKSVVSKKSARKPSKSKSPANGANITLANQAKKAANPKEVVFRENEFIAFVDSRESNEERFDAFTLGMVSHQMNNCLTDC